MAAGVFCTAAPPLPAMLSGRSNMKAFQHGHHVATLPMSSRQQLIGVGRFSTVPSAVVIVLVTRSGIEVSRFSPSPLSCMKPAMICRF
mgnify:CR=1 FL=1